jgi:signal transduction histidine kinase
VIIGACLFAPNNYESMIIYSDYFPRLLQYSFGVALFNFVYQVFLKRHQRTVSVLIRHKLLLGFLIIIAITIPNGVIGYLKVEQSLSKIENDIFTNLQDVKTASHLNNLAIYIQYYDEVLTQAARNYVFTGNEKWYKIYFDTEHELDRIIKEAITIGSEQERSFFQNIYDANMILVDIEHKAIQLRMEGRQDQAVAILEDQKYWQYKGLYKDALENYAKSKGLEYGQTYDTSTSNLENSVRDVGAALAEAKLLLYIGIPIVLLIATLLSYYIFKSLTVPLNQLKQTVEKISGGNYNVEFPKNRRDEIGDLAKRMESMLKSFKTSLETELQLTLAQEKLKTEKLTAIGELAARIAHDIRNPLSVIKNVCEIMKMQYGQKDPKIHEHIVRMENAIQRVSHQIDDVLDYVRNTPIQRKVVSLRDIIVRSVEDLQIQKNVTVNLPDNDEKINCDEQKIRTVISNIVLNSVQAMGGIGTITIKIKGYTKHVNIEISDSGPGIPEDVLPKIFEPLFTTKQTGTGLGLSSCKSIVEQHNGTITVKNNPTTFNVMLPRLS